MNYWIKYLKIKIEDYFFFRKLRKASKLFDKGKWVPVKYGSLPIKEEIEKDTK